MDPIRFDAEVVSGPSRRLWGDCPIHEILTDPAAGYGFFDDFTKGGLITSPTTSAALVGIPYSGFGSSGSTITYANAAGGGVVLAETTDNEGASIFTLNHVFRFGVSYQPLWFEASITPSTTATTEQSMFVGLADATAKTATVPLTATSTLADLNLVGFHKLETDLTSVKTVYKADSVTAVTLQTCTSALTAATATKLGFKRGRDNVLRFFIDGVEQTTTYTIADDLGTDFPNDVLMAPCIAMLLGAAASDNTLTVNWWRCYQLRA